MYTMFFAPSHDISKQYLKSVHVNINKGMHVYHFISAMWVLLTLKVLVTTIDAQWEGVGDVGSARYEPALLPPCPTIRVLNYSN